MNLEKRIRENIDRHPELLLNDLVSLCDMMSYESYGLLKIGPGYVHVRKDVFDEIKEFVETVYKVCEE